MFMPLCMHVYESCIHGDMACGYLGMCVCVSVYRHVCLCLCLSSLSLLSVFTNVASIMLNISRIIYVCHVYD
jgi:hypothetical protein